MMEIKAPKHTVVLIAVVAFIIFLSGCLIFIFHVRDTNEDVMVTYIRDSTIHRQADIKQHLTSNLQVLNGVAVSLGKLDKWEEDPVYNILYDINKGNSFKRMGIADLSGNVSLVDLKGKTYSKINVFDNPSFAKALGGDDAISSTFYEDATMEEVNYYFIPIFDKNNKIICVLCAVESGNVLKNLTDVSIFRDEGYFAVIDKVGEIVVPSVDPREGVEVGNSIYDLADMDPHEKTRMEKALVGGNEEDFRFPVFGEENIAVVEPIGVNGWSVISVVPLEVLNGVFNQTAWGIGILVIIASLFFIWLLIWQIRTSNKSKKELEKLAYIDRVTGLRNYTKFLIDVTDVLHENNVEKRKLAIWSLDIKAFNDINDIFGNDAGDKFLRFLGDTFKDREDEWNFVARVAGDNFVGIVEYKEKDELIKGFERLKHTIFLRKIIPESEKRIDFAAGCLCIDEIIGRPTVKEMINGATAAKKHAKSMSGTHLVFFDNEMRKKQNWTAILEASAQESMDNGELKFVLQPKVSIQGDDYRVVSAEVLVRWDHPEYGVISPGDFVPLFENNGFIVDMDRYIYRKACEWYVSYVNRYDIPLKIACNVSRQGLMRVDIVDYYSRVKEEFGIPDGALELEFTESVIVDDYTHFKNTIVKLQDRGFGVAIDDFGAGYSSLNILKSLPIDVLKLDAMFFKDAEDIERARTVISSFITLAHDLGIKTVSEGIEKMVIVEYLTKVGCDLIQGYVFSKPLFPEEFEKYISQDNGIITI